MKYRKLENRTVHYSSCSLREIAQVSINNEPSGSDTGSGQRISFSRFVWNFQNSCSFSKQKLYVLAREIPSLKSFPTNITSWKLIIFIHCGIGRSKRRDVMRTLLGQFGHVTQIVRCSLSKNSAKVNLPYRCEQFHSKNTSFEEITETTKKKFESIQTTDLSTIIWIQVVQCLIFTEREVAIVALK